MSRIICDIDGVVGDLMGVNGGGFCRWMRERNLPFDASKPENHRVSGQNRELLLQMLAEPNGYLDYVEPIGGAREALIALTNAGHDLRFVTSVTEAPKQFASKFDWLERNFGDITSQIYTIPSREKHFVAGDYVIEDRADTIVRFAGMGERRGLFLFVQPWNFSYGTGEPDDWTCDEQRFVSVARTLSGLNRSMSNPTIADGRRELPIPFITYTNSWTKIVQEIEDDQRGG